MNLLISLYDRTGNWSCPYREAGWKIMQIDIQNGSDIMEWDYKSFDRGVNRVIILAAQPCDRYALCGNRHKAGKLFNGEFDEAQKLVAKTKEIIDYFNPFAWVLENPRTDIHKKNEWIGQRPKFTFDPCDFAGWNPVDPGNDQYNKDTWLFGKFNDPVKKRLEPIVGHYPGWSNLGGKSIETKNARSITPLGFAYAFFDANH